MYVLTEEEENILVSSEEGDESYSEEPDSPI